MEATRLDTLSPTRRTQLLDRDAPIADINTDVAEIIDTVNAHGDEALRDYAATFDDVHIETLTITDEAASAYESIDEEIRTAIETAATNIRAFHHEQLPSDWQNTTDGRTLGRRYRPIDRVGIYVPGGTAAYPSSALMGVIPAVVAGVEDIVVTTPPATDPNPVTLAAIHAAGADEVYAAGGAQAIAALAYGTETIAPVRKVVGPGNRWVTAAKAAVRGDVAIDFLAGPSEILVLADEYADPTYIAADLIAQAEHDPDASAVAVTTDSELADEIVAAIDAQLSMRDRADIAEQALANPRSGVFIVDSMTEATTFAQAYAPEHLSVQTTDPDQLIDEVPSAGSVFLGGETPVAAGDYATGTNHILPTSGMAHTHSGVTVDTFLRSSTVQHLDQSALASLRDTIATLAMSEGLEGHAASIHTRFEDSN